MKSICSFFWCGKSKSSVSPVSQPSKEEAKPSNYCCQSFFVSSCCNRQNVNSPTAPGEELKGEGRMGSFSLPVQKELTDPQNVQTIDSPTEKGFETDPTRKPDELSAEVRFYL